MQPAAERWTSSRACATRVCSEGGGAPICVECRRVSVPFLIARLKTALRPWVPSQLRAALSRVAPPALRTPGIQYAGNFPNWSAARESATGYDAPLILEKAVTAARQVNSGAAPYERDTVVFSEVQQFWPLLAGLLWVASASAGRLSVLDFGGALGSSYHQNRRFLEHLGELRWSIVEQSHFVEAGRREFQTEALRFYSTLEACIAAERPNLWLLSGVVQYLEHPFELIRTICESSIPYALFDRVVLVADAPTRLTVQTVPPQIYDASYPCWVFNEQEFERSLTSHFEIVARFDSHAGNIVELEDARARYAGVLLRRREG